MKKKVLLLGLGKQGKAVLFDLVKSEIISKVVVVDRQPKTKMDEYIQSLSTSKEVRSVEMDSKNEDELYRLMRKEEIDIAVELLPGTLTLPVARLAVKNGISLVSTMPYEIWEEKAPNEIQARNEELRQLDEKAKSKGIIVLSKFGMDPGIEDVLDAQAIKELDEVHEYYSYGAGFPELKAANNPLKYKFTWSVVDCMMSYRLPARIIKEGKIVDNPAADMFSQSNMHMLNLKEIGSSLEAFAEEDAVERLKILGVEIDKVRMAGKYICRWPGHGAFWEKISKCSLINNVPIKVGGVEVVPREFMATVLGSQEQFQYAKDEQDIALLRSDVRGVKDGKKKRVVYQIVDKRDLTTGFTAMQRTVGFTVSIGAQMILNGTIKKHGLISPTDIPFDIFRNELSKRNINITQSVTVED